MVSAAGRGLSKKAHNKTGWLQTNGSLVGLMDINWDWLGEGKPHIHSRWLGQLCTTPLAESWRQRSWPPIGVFTIITTAHIELLKHAMKTRSICSWTWTSRTGMPSAEQSTPLGCLLRQRERSCTFNLDAAHSQNNDEETILLAKWYLAIIPHEHLEFCRHLVGGIPPQS